MRNPVATAAQMTSQPDRLSEAVYQRRVKAFDEKRTALLAKRSTLLPLERETINAIDEQIRKIDLDRSALEDRQRQLPYPILSLEPLTWRNRQGYPRLVLFSPMRENWQLVVGKQNGQDAFQTAPEYDDVIRDLYDDVVQRLLNQIADGTRATLTANWTGVIPVHIKDKIATLRSTLEDENNVFLLAEPSSYSLSFKEIPKPVKVPNPDPLLVVIQDDVLYLVDKFDVTPLEHYVASEFAT